MNQNVSCRLLCRGEKYIEKSYNKKQVVAFENFIKADYRVHWLMDNLPAATKVTADGVDRYVRGYPIGFVDSTKVSVYWQPLWLIGLFFCVFYSISLALFLSFVESLTCQGVHLFNHIIIVGKIHSSPDKTT